MSNKAPESVKTTNTVLTRIGEVTLETALQQASTTTSPDLAASIVDDLYKARHDSFGEYVSEALMIPIRDDCDARTIFDQIPKKYIIKDDVIEVDNIIKTPDNFLIDENRKELILIDYKVANSFELVTSTISKYKESFAPMQSLIDLEIIVCVIMFSMKDERLIIEPLIHQARLMRPPSQDTYTSLREITEAINTIKKIWESNEVFASQMQGYTVSKGDPWVNSKTTADFYDSTEWLNFSKTLKSTNWLGFIERAIEEIPTSRLKQGSANNTIIEGAMQYDAIVERDTKEILHNIKLNTEIFQKYKNPTRKVLTESWKELESILDTKYDLSMGLHESKPVLHSTWAPDTPEIKKLFQHASNENGNIKKIMMLSLLMRSVEGNDENSRLFKFLGQSMNLGQDPKEAIKLYEAHLALKREETLEIRKNKKTYARLVKKDIKAEEPQNKKGQKTKIGEAVINHSQQFRFHNNPDFKHIKKNFLNLAHIGGYVNFKNSTEETIREKLFNEDGTRKKIKMLNFNNPQLVLDCEKILSANHDILQTEIGETVLRGDIDSILEGLSIDKKSDLYQYYQWIRESNYYKASMDIGDLILNAMKMGFNTDRNYFRCLVSGSKSTFLLLLPSDSVVSKNSSICYVTVSIHKKGQIPDFGCTYMTKKILGQDNLYLSLSKPMRLDKPRMKRLSMFNYYFQLSVLSMLSESKVKLSKECVLDVCKICFYLCGSVSKSLMSLTEPCRYIMMNSFSLCSDIKGYITDKFDPRSKTWFSVCMLDRMVKGSLNAFDNRRQLSLMELKYDNDIALSFGVTNKASLESLWFKKKCNIKEYLLEIYTPFYLNSKDLHNYSSNIIQLIKVPIEIEEMLSSDWEPWGQGGKQKVDLDVYIPSICKYYHDRKFKMNKTRSMIEGKNNFNKKIFSIDTMTSSKSCIVRGYEMNDTLDSTGLKDDIPEYIKEKQIKRERQRKAGKRVKCEYSEIRTDDFIDIYSNKVFDELYSRVKSNPEYYNKKFSEIGFDVMANYKEIYMSLFPKSQRTFVDREIYLGEFELKMCLYIIERIYKEQCADDTTEQISNPGDAKMKTLQELRLKDMKTLSQLLIKNKEVHSDGTILEVNADMSKWSAQDVTYKYIVLVAIDPNLFPAEKKSIIKFFMRYINKKLIIPNNAMEILKNQYSFEDFKDNDLLRTYLNDFTTNHVTVRQNWLQGNLNYTSSFVHTISMSYMKSVMNSVYSALGCESRIDSLVHSDDNQTTCVISYPNKPTMDLLEIDELNQYHLSRIFMYGFTLTTSRFAQQVNTKKTNVSEIIKEFVSLINLHGECFSIYPRFVLPSVGDCAFLGPYEDLASRLSSVRSALKHGCSLNLAKISIAVSTVCSYNTYSMLKGQENDPLTHLPFNDRSCMPLELGGYPKFDLGLFMILGMESQDITMINEILITASSGSFKINPQQERFGFDVEKLSNDQKIYATYIRNYMLDSEITAEQNLGETYDLKSRSIITPRLFSTVKVLNKLKSYNDHKLSLKLFQDEIINYIINKPYLAIGKAENSEEYQYLCKYRYYSRRFKESLSVQNSNQLFVEQFLQSKAATIDKESVRNISMIRVDEDDTDGLSLMGRITIKECLKLIGEDILALDLKVEDIDIIMDHKINLEPTVTTCVNTLNLFEPGFEREVQHRYVTKIEQLSTIRNIFNTPANILRYYITKDINSVNNTAIVEDTLKSDIAKLEDFIRETQLEEKLGKKLLLLEQTHPNDKKNEMFIITKKMQTLYGYLAQNAVRQNYIMLGTRSERNPQSFIQNVIKSTRKDGFIVANTSVANVLSMGAKGTIARNKSNLKYKKMQILSSILTFMNDFIDVIDHERFLNVMLDNAKYQDLTLREMATKLSEQESNRLIQPGLFAYLRLLKDSDIDILKAGNNSYTLNYETRQLDNDLNVGKCVFQIYNSTTTVRMELTDSVVDNVQMAVYNIRSPNFSNELQKAMRFAKNKKGLQIDLFTPKSKDSNISPKEKVLWMRKYTKKGKEQVDFRIATSYEITFKNDQIVSQHVDSSKIQLYTYLSKIRLETKIKQTYDVATIRNQNQSITSVLRYKLDNDVSIQYRRAHVSNIKDIELPADLEIKDINVKKLLTSPLLTKEVKLLERVTYATFADLFQCSGTNETEATFQFFGDTDTTEENTLELSSHLIPNITTTSRGTESYKSAISRIARTKAREFGEEVKVYKDDLEMTSLDNMNKGVSDSFVNIKKYIETIFQLCGMIEGAYWDKESEPMEEIKKNLLHYYYKTDGRDIIFHSINVIPKKLFISEINQELNTMAVQRALQNNVKLMYGGMDLLKPFKEDIEYYIKRKIADESKFSDPLEELFDEEEDQDKTVSDDESKEDTLDSDNEYDF